MSRSFSEAFGLATTDRARLQRHDERVRFFGCAHDTRLEYGGGWMCLEAGCDVAFGLPGFPSSSRNAS